MIGCFDYINKNKIFEGLAECCIDSRDITLLKHISQQATASLKLLEENQMIRITREVVLGK